MHQRRRFKCNIMSSRDDISTPPCKASVGHTDGNSKQANYGYHGDRGFRGSPDGCIYDEPPIARTTNSTPGPEVYRPRRPRLERPRRASTTTTSITSRAAPPISGHVDHDHVPSSSAELRPHRPPDHVAMMIAAKNGATTIVTTVMATGRKARGPDNFIATNQMSIQR